ncbi:hypothetical protein [Arthrobacter sp. CAN_C5]|uniref:hypothetical protein n=1 Tax=Arthrobacter sp. CAN_C5 TaxID=2760706 RepID=UPI001FD9080E|nr:hypothetical protein [Arthrobacter sp. CAN_C5]MBP2215445.1 hypothetical protein [Arthrobacter sp. CAN_C5]
MSSEQPPPRNGDADVPAPDAATPADETPATDNSLVGASGNTSDNARGQAPARREVTVRRAPRFAPFMGLGVLVGVIIAAIVAYAGPGDPTLTRESIFGFFIMVFAIPGLLLGALLVLVLDRISVRRSRRTVAERTYDDESHTD